MSTLRIGRCGELLVQYQLLKRGIESAPMTTDSGIDLVAFSAKEQRAITIQVKSCDAPKPGGGRGKLALDWWIADHCPAEIAAFVDLSTDAVWLFRMAEFTGVAQRHSGGRYHFYMYTDPSASPRITKAAKVEEFDAHRLERCAQDLFGAR